VAGVPGIGAKMAATLLGQFGSVKNLVERADEIEPKSRREKYTLFFFFFFARHSPCCLYVLFILPEY
jgi:hypothetical protein